MSDQMQECCPKFDPAPWDGTTHDWHDRIFMKETLPTFMYMPLPFTISRMMNRMWKKMKAADAVPEKKDWIWLAYAPSPWKSEHYIYVTKEVNSAENVHISGKFITNVFDGPYKDTPKWMKAAFEFVKEKGQKAMKQYVFYTTCPKCAKKYGHNYAVVFSQTA